MHTLGGRLLRRWKQRSGYYEARRHRRLAPFRRALRATDTFLVGHPKSGNTWLAYMLAIVLFRDREGAITLANVGDFVPYVHGRDHRIAKYQNLPDPRVFRNEDPQYPDQYPKTIYLVRDPRAALVSFWRMYQTMFDEIHLGLDHFLEQYMSHAGIFEWWNSKLVRWDHQVAAALERAERDPSFVVVSYEELVRDRASQMLRLAEFLGVGHRPDALHASVQRGAFDAMRRLEERHGTEAYKDRAKGRGNFVRVGRIDGWRDEMTDVQADRVLTEMGPVMERAGYS